MAKVLGKPFGKVCSVVLAVLLLLGVAFAFVGCESDYPQIRITHSRSWTTTADTDDTYVLNYRLSRKMYKQTVNHYIELIDAGILRRDRDPRLPAATAWSAAGTPTRIR